MHFRHSLPVVLLAFAAPAVAQSGSVRDFRLPPDPEATPTPEVQGPVDPEAPIVTAPRVIPTETPTPRATATPTPAPTQQTPQQTPPQAAPTPRPTIAPATPAAPEPAPMPQATSAGTTASPAEEAATQGAATPRPEVAPPPPSQPQGSSSSQAFAPEEGPDWAVWLAALVAALVVAGGLFAFLRRRRGSEPAPAIERPLTRAAEQAPPPDPTPAPAAGTSSPASAPAPKPSQAPALVLSAQPVRFSRSMMNATFACRIALENRGSKAWEDIVVEADLVTAHGAAPIGDQLADPATPLAPVQSVAALPAGESLEIAAEVRLPLQQVRVIRQGSAAVYVPLLRLRVTARGKAPVAQTYLVGQLPDRAGGRLRPFRLDEMPQVYQAIGIRALGDPA